MVEGGGDLQDDRLGLDKLNFNSFRIMSGSTVDPNNDPNKKESSITLMDARQSLDPLPIQRIQLDKVHDVKRYVAVIIIDVWGSDSGQIDYFDIERKWPNKIFKEAKVACEAKSGDCDPKPQYCPTSACISDTVWWQDIKHPGYYQRGCSTIGENSLFESAAKCVKKEAFDNLNPPFLIDTSDSSLMDDCSSWSDTEPCEEEFLQISDKMSTKDENFVTDIFKISSDDCDAGVKIELVDINTMEPTGNFLSYTDTVNSSIEVGDDEQCFIIKDALCGPNSISFTTPGDLFLTFCNNLLLLREEFDYCG